MTYTIISDLFDNSDVNSNTIEVMDFDILTQEDFERANSTPMEEIEDRQ